MAGNMPGLALSITPKIDEPSALPLDHAMMWNSIFSLPRYGFSQPNRTVPHHNWAAGLFHISDIGQTLDTATEEGAKPLKYMALPSGIEPLSPP
jgi:hypothetical protein